MSARIQRARPQRRAAALLIACALPLAGPAPAPARAALPDAATSAVPPRDVPDPLPLAWCLEHARETNPDIARARALAEAARHRVVPAGALEDPRLSYEASNLPTGAFDLDSTPMSGQQLGLRQKLPFPGVLGARRQAAEHGAEAAALAHADRALHIAGAVEQAWSELAFAQRALEITERNVELMRQLVGTAESRYGVGSGLQQDVLRAHVELTALTRQRLQTAANVAAAEAMLVALLDLPASTRLPAVGGLRSDAALPTLDPLLDAAERTNAALRAARARVEEQHARVRVAQLRGYPDMDLGLGYRVRARAPGDPVAGDDFLSAGVTLRLPMNRSRQAAEVAEQRALLRRAEADYRVARASVWARLRSAHAELERAGAEEALLESGLVPQARQSLEASRSGYAVGRLDFLGVLDSQVRLLEAELRLTRARADERIAFAALEMAAGEKLR